MNHSNPPTEKMHQNRRCSMKTKNQLKLELLSVKYFNRHQFPPSTRIKWLLIGMKTSLELLVSKDMDWSA